MSDLRPQPIKLKLGDKTINLLFTLRAIDEIQEHFDIPIAKIGTLLADEKKRKENIAIIISALAQEDIEPSFVKLFVRNVDYFSSAITLAILSGAARGEDDAVPPPDPQKLNVAHFIFVGTALLGYPESEVWGMTLKKILILRDEYLKFNGRYKAPETIDDVIPF
jgi:hypothetical protein